MAPDDRGDLNEGSLSRRGFLGRGALGAGVLGAACFVPRAVAAAVREEDRAEGSRHPLDPLSASEIVEAVRVIRAARPISPSYRFMTIVLAEPPKSALQDERVADCPREAAVLFMDRATGHSYEAIVDLGSGMVRSYQRVADGLQPSITIDEFVECEAAIKRSPEFLAALRKRGVTDPNLVMIDPWPAGTYGDERHEERGKRLVRALAFVRSEPTDNGFARPLDGVVAVFDLHTMQMVRVDDHGVVPLPPEPGNWARSYFPEKRAGLQSLAISQPEGPSFTVDGHEVAWQNWKFRVGFTPREGLVLHTIRYRDGGRDRQVMHRASICEMVVPYGDPAEKYFRKNPFDMGEYGMGTMANSLTPGCDCLGSIRYFDAHLTNSQGQAVTIKDAICLHEEDAGILWKHTDGRLSQTEVRRARRLSVSYFATAGNYDYGFYWHFYQDGSIQCEVKLTGVMNTTALAPGESPAYGVEVAPRLCGPFHQHIFAARLDLDVDGSENAVYEVNMVSPPLGPENPHGNAFRAEATLLARESQAKRRVSTPTSRFWRIVNPARRSRLGQPVGYRLVPGENAPPLVHEAAAIMKRAGFTAHNLWVTPYRPEERHAAGDYPNQHPTGDGLPVWTAADRNVADTDLVVWYVFAHTHVPRPEDWPVMPVSALGFWLKPDGFFERNPALDLPPPVV
jgi:primary-amine oxidase